MHPQPPLLRTMRALLHSGGHASLREMARQAGRSPFHFQRTFRSLAGETPKQFQLRVRLERAATALVATDASVLAVSRAAGFHSHEVFARAFRRLFGCSAIHYRRNALIGASQLVRKRHRHVVEHGSPCVRLHYLPMRTTRRSSMSLLSIEKKEIAPLPFLFIRRQAARSEVSQTLGECFGAVFSHCMKSGLAVAGFPLARYPVVGPGLMTIEAGVPLIEPTVAPEGMQYTELPSGPTVFAIHGGPYDDLGDTHAAIERWMQQHALRAGGPHWEWYVTDPAGHPDPKDWRTHIYYPLAK